MDLQQAFGYTQESIKFLLSPMAERGEEAIGSMGTDTPISALSSKSKLLHTYFKQNFAQVTNPPIDSIREELVMSLFSFIGPRPNLLELEGTSRQKRLEVDQPILTNEDLERIRGIGAVKDNDFASITIDITYPADKGEGGMGPALDCVCAEAEECVRAKEFNIIILSDRRAGPDRIAIPSLLATSAVHHHLIKQGLRTSVGLVVETGEAHEIHQFCTLAGYGAEAINPYLAFETLYTMLPDLPEGTTPELVKKRYIKAIGKALLKVMAKMGISTYQSYCGAQIFDAVGLRSSFVNRYFTGTHTQVEGVGLREIARETVERHTAAFGDVPILANALDVGGEYAYRIRGEDHMWRPGTVADLQHAVRGTDNGDAMSGRIPQKFRDYSKSINDQSEQLMTLRGMFRIRSAESMGRKPIPLEEVEPAVNIVKRFATGAMSFGSISREAHTTLAIAMNRIGGRSNTGEGGEEADRFKPLPNGDSMRSAIKQVASGRFGVTTEYLVNSDMMQIKMAQGAKPGEGGQLPGYKVDAVIAKVRHSTPGVGLISPPPHHDIYSIEDLAQLIFDLKNVNPAGDVSVKLVSEVGVGTVAAGVAKARADHVTISGFEGGTGASPLTSLKHAGSPWEIGLAETHQTLVANRLRGRIAVQVDGGVRTGRDVVIGALLGADEFGFATAPLIAAGCIMMRKCHLNTCPVGVATQDPVLRARFTGKPEHVINFFFFVAEEVREIMAQLGFRTFNEMVGQSDQLDKDRAIEHWKARGLDFTKLLHKPHAPKDVAIYNCERQDHGLDKVLDVKLIEIAKPALASKKAVKAELAIKNINRSTGAMLSGEVARRYGHAGLPEDTIWLSLKGTAGQAFGAWLAHGVTLDLVGEANDYVGKGLSGGKLIVRPDPKSGITPEESIIVGNTVLYGAITRRMLFPRRRRRTVRRQKLRRLRRCRRHRRSRLRIHDRRRRCRARPDRAQFRGRHVGRHRLRARREGRLRSPAQQGHGAARSAHRRSGLAREACAAGRRCCGRRAKRHGRFAPTGRRASAHAHLAARALHQLAPGAGDPEGLRGLSAEVQESHAGRISPCARRTRESARNEPRGGDAQQNSRQGRPEPSPKGKAGSLKPGEARTVTNWTKRKTNGQAKGVFGDRPRRPEVQAGRRAHEALQGIRRSARRARGQEAGCPLHGLRHSLLPHGLPGQQSDPRLERPRLRGDWKEAAENLHSTNNFPEVTGRICPAPCEASCTLNIDDKPVTIKTIEYSIAERAWEEGWTTSTAARTQDRQESCHHRLRSGGPRRSPAAGARRPRCPRLREERASPAACSSMAFPISRWKRPSSRGASSRWKPRA